jgi:hypothetical protein
MKCKFYFFVFCIFLLMRVIAFLSFLCAEEVRRGISQYKLEYKKLDLCRVNSVLFEFSKNHCESIFKPKSLSFERHTFLEFLIMLNCMLDFLSRICSFPLYRVNHASRTLISDSHKKDKFKSKVRSYNG